jgi:hypothetical protein
MDAGSVPRPVRGRRVTVTLSENDWMDLTRFLVGDIHNMEEGCPVKNQMRRICDTISSRVYTPNTERIGSSAPVTGSDY